MKRPGKSVRLRPVREGDLEAFYEDQRDPVADRMAGLPARDHDAFMVHWKRLMADGTVMLRTILHEGEVAGNIVSFTHGDTREVGYWIRRDRWGKGIATEALRLFLRVDSARPLHAGVVRHNLASIRVLEKCGFRRAREVGEEVILKLD
jgi:RimJ/RimL family protein N-acetyltransferase